MKRSVRIMQAASALAIVITMSLSSAAAEDDAGPRDIPPALAPFEYLIGRWNGNAIPKDNPTQKFRGWEEKHTWAWKFAKGKPVGMTLSIEGGKILKSGTLTHEPAKKLFRLEAIEPGPAAASFIFEGTLDKSGKHLMLDHTEVGRNAAKSKGVMRLTLWPNANFIRYTMAHDIKEPDSIQFTHLIEVGLTKDGESLAGAGAAAAEHTKCIVTGGAATMTLSFQGRTFPICCSGCRDEFNENPEKYIKKASMMAASAASKPKSAQQAASSVGRFEDAFSGDVVDSPKVTKRPTGGSTKPMAKEEATADSKPSPTTKSGDRDKTDEGASAIAKQASRAASLLKLGQNLERSGNATAALGYYRRVVKEFEKTAAAKTAASRIKALDQP